ncbi:MAG: sigma-54-dependent Fis family transcriptional regulator [Proteobacteria bacterium]|nr:sigma-54-dependent Fis family transcriptional regulator [Pseudomonadota bacterium]
MPLASERGRARTSCGAVREPGEGCRALVGNDPALQRVRERIARFGPTQLPVVIVGETGTGKELVARALHDASARREGPFEAVNCAAIPHELAESELFGHARGAFTGALGSYAGALRRADGGTLFLDEIGEMPRAMQPKLLRALEEGRVRPVGAELSQPIDVRVVAATNRALDRDADQGRFRLDLYHRLAVAVIPLPALRERAQDIPLLVEHFLARASAREQRPPPALAPDVLGYLQRREWKGNVRALRNAIDRALISGGRVLQRQDFEVTAVHPAMAQTAREGHVRYEGRSFAAVRREIYMRVLRQHGGKRAAAAAALGIARSTFSDQLRAMDIE